ncbi:hypothetical protein [Echinicola shivajiensis]|uniref:hypothetical protein n=1 Tax=Echinicola shivajiensis TaxID=1035916 RepID=UPI001BFC3CD3|nr:hypothetical protein [Echinicola shivajiensis]
MDFSIWYTNYILPSHWQIDSLEKVLYQFLSRYYRSVMAAVPNIYRNNDGNENKGAFQLASSVSPISRPNLKSTIKNKGTLTLLRLKVPLH